MNKQLTLNGLKWHDIDPLKVHCVAFQPPKIAKNKGPFFTAEMSKSANFKRSAFAISPGARPCPARHHVNADERQQIKINLNRFAINPNVYID